MRPWPDFLCGGFTFTVVFLDLLLISVTKTIGKA